jgi:hypothetical protein
MPAVDVAETDKAYEITAELLGLDEKNIEVKLANGVLSIKCKKQEDKESLPMIFFPIGKPHDSCGGLFGTSQVARRRKSARDRSVLY